MTTPTAERYVCLRYGSEHTESTSPNSWDAEEDAVRRLTAQGMHVVWAAEAEAMQYAQHEYVLHDELEVMFATAAAYAYGVGPDDHRECGDMIVTVDGAMATHWTEGRLRHRARAA